MNRLNNNILLIPLIATLIILMISLPSIVAQSKVNNYTKIPPMDKLFQIYGIKADPTTSDFGNAQLNLEDDVKALICPLAGDPYTVDNVNELAIGLLLSTSTKIISTPKTEKFAKSFTPKEAGIHSIYLIRDLIRKFPENYSIYRVDENKLSKMFSITTKEINDYCIGVTKQYLQEYAKDNKYFTYFIPNTDKITPEMNLIFQYLLASDVARPAKKNALIKLTLALTREGYEKGMDSSQAIKSREFRILVENYSDINSFVLKADESIILGK
jgi:hypothetical protein